MIGYKLQMKLYHTIVFIISQLIIQSIYAQELQSVEVNFFREIKKNKSIEVTEGTFIHDRTDLFNAISLSTPIKQTINFENNNLIIYYPDKKEAIKIKSNSSVSLSFFYMYINLLEKDIGLEEKGFILFDSYINGNELTTYWKRLGKKKKTDVIIILKYINNDVHSVQIKSKNNSLISHSFYKDYITTNGIRFPGVIQNEFYTSSDTTIETITYNNVNINQKLSVVMSKYLIPPETIIIDAEW